MARSIFLYNSVSVSLPKNVAQFMLGAVLFWLVYGSFGMMALVALAAFLMTYSAVYFFNDLADYKDDIRDREKRHWKLVASGKLSRREAAASGLLLLVAGVSLSYLVNIWFLLIMAGLIFLNFLHSSPWIRLKKSIPVSAVNMTAIEFLKYSSGWFALTSNLNRFPFWLILCFSIIYSCAYLAYKFRFKGDVIRRNKYTIVPLGLAAVFSYLVSLVLYQYALPMLMLLAISLLLAKFGIGRRLRMMRWLWIEFAILPFVLIAFLLLAVPPIAEANENITVTICGYKDQIYHSLPEDLAENIRDIAEPRFESLDELGCIVMNSTMNFNITSLSFLEPRQ